MLEHIRKQKNSQIVVETPLDDTLAVSVLREMQKKLDAQEHRITKLEETLKRLRNNE
jgi:hypothetical protein